MKNDEDFEKFNDLSSLSDVHIDNEEEHIPSIGILACDQNLKFLFQETKQVIFFFTFLLLISFFIPSKHQSTEISHRFDSKHYPNYTFFTQINQLPKYSINGFFVSLKFLNFKDYMYEPKHDNKLAHIPVNKIKNCFYYHGNLSIQISSLSANKHDSIYNIDFQHAFLILNQWDFFRFRWKTKTDEFIIFSDKLPNYDTFILNMTVSARHPRAEEMIIKFYYSPNIYEIFDILIRISLIICIFNTEPHFFYSKSILNDIKAANIYQTSKLSIHYTLTFILRFITILYIFASTISRSIGSISLFQIPYFSFIMNINIIICDLFFSYSLFYIISILRMIEKEVDITAQYLIQGSKENQNNTIDECYDNRLSFLIKPFMIFTPFLIFMIINDCDNKFSSAINLQNNLISIAPKGFFIFRTLESIGNCHLFLFFVFLYFLASTFYKLKKKLVKKKLKDNLFDFIKNRSKNYFLIILPHVLLLFFIVLKDCIVFAYNSSKSEMINVKSQIDKKLVDYLNSDFQNEPKIKIVNFTSKSFENFDECKNESKFFNLFFFSLVNILSFRGRTAFLPALSIILPSLFTIVMSILHTPSKLLDIE